MIFFAVVRCVCCIKKHGGSLTGLTIGTKKTICFFCVTGVVVFSLLVYSLEAFNVVLQLD